MTRLRILVEDMGIGDIPSFDFPPEYEGKILTLMSDGSVHQHPPGSRRIGCQEYEMYSEDLTFLRTKVLATILSVAVIAREDGFAIVSVRSSYSLKGRSADGSALMHVFSYCLLFSSCIEPRHDSPVHPWIPRTVTDPEAMLSQIDALLTVAEVLQS